MKLHPGDGSRCAPETCGGVSYDPCSYEKPRAVYVVGGAGSGKSTFMDALMGVAVFDNGPLEALHTRSNKRNPVTLRGHRLWDYRGRSGVYLGVLRDSFPGTDGLDRVSGPTGEEWLQECMHLSFSFIVAEGATLSSRTFLHPLHEYAELLLVHLIVDDETRLARFAERGSSQNARFVQNTVTRSANVAADMQKLGCTVLTVDTADPNAWELGVDIAATWIA